MNEQEEFEFRLRLEQESEQESSAPSLGSAALQDVKEMGKGLVSGVQMFSPANLNSPTMGKAQQIGEFVKGVPGALYERGKELVTDPVGSFQRKPISTALDLLPVASIATKGLSAAGTAGRVGLESLGNRMSLLKKPLGTAVKQTMGSVLGPSEEAISARLARPEAIKSAVPYTDLSEQMSETLGKLQKTISAEDDLAWDSLLKLKSEPRSEVLKLFENLKKKLKGTGGVRVGEGDSRALSSIDKYIERLQDVKQKGIDPSLDQMLDQRQIRELLQSVRNDVDFSNPTKSSLNSALEEFQAKLSDRLKANNPEYEKIMGPLAEKTKLFAELKRAFSLKNEDGGLVPTDTTAGKFPQILNENRSYTRDNLLKLKDLTKKDFIQKADDWRLADQFSENKDFTRGSKRTNLFANIGTGIGAGAGAMFGPMGAAAGGVTGRAAGAMVGSYVDRAGGQIAAKILDSYLKNKGASMGKHAAVVRKYGPILEKASTMGAEKLAIANEMIQQADPEYAELTGKIITIPVANNTGKKAASVLGAVGVGSILRKKENR